MSLDDCDEGNNWQAESIRRARKDHRCDACHEVISRTHRYHRLITGYDDSVTTWTHCLRCWAICEALWKNGAGIIDLRLECEHEWREAEHSHGKEPPPEVERLAFLSPDEAQKELAS